MSVAAPTTRQLVVCSLGPEEYGLPIAHVREIVRAVEPRSVVSDVPWMRGVISLRGRLVPVYDLAHKLGLDPAGRSAPTKIVIVEDAGELAGLLVDDVVEVLTLEETQIETVPGGSSIARVGERLVLLLEADLA